MAILDRPEFQILDTSRPYRKVDKEKNSDWCEQNGWFFYWSESNINYEWAWWLYTNVDSPLVNNLKKERPLPEGELI